MQDYSGVVYFWLMMVEAGGHHRPICRVIDNASVLESRQGMRLVPTDLNSRLGLLHSFEIDWSTYG